MVTAYSPFVAPTRIGREAFGEVLRRAGSPWAERGGEIWALIVHGGQDPAVWLVIAGEEHGYGANRESVLWRCRTNSWTNARTVRDPELSGWEIVVDPVRRSPYVRYRDVLDSVRDGLYRVTDPTYRYVREGRTTIGQVLAIWTEGDGAGYAARVVTRMNGWVYERLLGGMVDLRRELPARDPGDGLPAGPFERRPLREKRGIVVHYSGPPVANRADTVAVLRAEARYHVEKDWSHPGDPPVYGDGLMYHVAVGADGTAYLCRDPEAVLWHCGAWPQNAIALSLHVPIGGEQRATAAQLATLQRVCDDWREVTGTGRDEVWGHQELSPTACPGTLMDDFVRPCRQGRRFEERSETMTDGQWFGETGHYVGGGFWTFWRERGGLPIFGFPLTDELREEGLTVQYFERAVFEWHPGNDDPWKVLLRRVGAEALAARERPEVRGG